ncbi:MAG: hypothetical protein ACXQT3_04385 [Methermicoccaceae archaeon]
MLTRQRRFVYTLSAWMFVVLALMCLTHAFDLTLFFILMLIGFLVLVELMSPYHVAPKWLKRLSWIVAAGVIVFMLIVIKRAMEVLGT